MLDKKSEEMNDEMAESKRRADRLKEVSASFDESKDSDIAKMLAEIEANNKKFKK